MEQNFSFEFGVPFIRWADTVRVVAGGHGARHRQIYDHELVYILEGNGTVVLNGVAYPAQPDSLFFVTPRTWHTYASPHEPQRLLGIHFDWQIQPDTAAFTAFRAAYPPVDEHLFRVAREIQGWKLAEQPFLDLKGRPQTRKLLESVMTEYARGDQESRANAGALLAAGIGHIAREARLLAELRRNSAIGADAVRRVQRARELLEASHEGALRVEEVANRVGWSGDHLRRMFRAVFDESPAQVQSAARIRRAQELLRYGGMAIHEIALRCGFDDASHFSRTFKRETGHTPREWLGLERNSENQSRKSAISS